MSKPKNEKKLKSVVIMDDQTFQPTDEVVTESNVEEVEVTEIEDDSIEEGEDVEARYLEVQNCDKLNVRKEPSKESEVLDVVPVKTRMKYTGSLAEEWTNVTMNDGTEGFVMTEFIKEI